MKSPFKSRVRRHGREHDETDWLLLDSDVPRVKEGAVKSFLSWICDPNCRPYRYAIAILLALIQGMLSYITDMPGGIQTTLIRVMTLDNSHYDMIFSAYSWADIVMSVVGAVTVNKYFGVRLGLILFLTVVLLGQLLYAIGGFLNSFWFSLIGRVIIGAGMGTSVSVLVSFQILWFEGKEITFIISLSRSMCRIMATISLFTPQVTYDALKTIIPSLFNRLGTTHMVGVLCSVLAIIFASGVVLLDVHGAKVIGRKPPRKKKMNFLHVLSFPASFWIVALLCSLYYSVIVSFTANGPLFFVSKYELSSVLANLANSLSYASIAAVTPFLALAIDFIGYNLIWGNIGIWMAIISNVLFMGFGNDKFIPFLAATMLSFSFSFFGSAMWVIPGFIVNKYQITTAYGVVMSVYALVISVVGVVAGVIIDRFGYFVLGMFYIVLLFVMSLLTSALSVSELFADRRVINISGKRRRKNN